MGLSGRDELRRLIKDLGKLPPDLRRELRPAIRKAAHPVLEEMQRNAGWSSRIPSATKISTSLSGSRAGVSLRTNASRAPHARPYEHGGSAGNFRHPVFGNRDNWVAARARPYFFRSVDDQADNVRDAVADVVIEVARRHGF